MGTGMKIKKRTKRLIAFMLSAMLCMSAFSTIVVAEEEDPSEEDESDVIQGISEEESDADEDAEEPQIELEEPQIPEEESTEPATFTASDNGVEVKVTVPSDALPEEAKLSVAVSEVKEEEAESREQTTETAQASDSFTFSAGEEDETKTGTIVLDISFYADGKEVEPTEPAEVVIDASGLLAGAGEVIESIEVWHIEETPEGNNPVLVDEVSDPGKAAEGIAEFSVGSFSEFEFHYTCSSGGWAGFGVNLIDENGNIISARVSSDDYIIDTSGRYDTIDPVDMPYTITIEEFTKVFTFTSASYTFLYATVTDPNYGDTEHTFDVWENEEKVGANELYGSEENPVVSVTINGTAAAENPNYDNETIKSKTWHFTLTFADETSVTIPIYGNADGDNDNGGKYCPKYLEINLYFNEGKEAVLNLGNGNGTYSDGDYTGSSSSGGDALRYKTGLLDAYADEYGKATINLPSDNDLDNEFTVVDAVGNEGEEGYQPAVTIALGKEQAYDYKLVGWINIATGEYYDVSGGSTKAKIDLSDDNVFYADWIGANYDRGSSSDENLRDDTVSTSGFVTLRMFDYNELFDLYSASLVQNGTEGETWTDSGYLYSKPLLGNTDLTPITDSFIFQNNGTTYANSHVLSHANPARWNLWTSNSVWSNYPEYNFVLDAEKYWNITSPSSTILGMLYDTSEESLGVHYVGDADYLFWVDEDGYYTYDSAVSGAAYNQSDERFYVYYDDANAFYPYNGHTEDRTSTNGFTDYWFGLNMEVNMYLPTATTAGSVNNPVNQVNEQDMVFDFSGDDDIMIFIDGKMVVDMSGIHSTSYSRINFSTNTVTYSMGLDANGAPNMNSQYSETSNLNLSAGGHTMQIFYMERGASASNLKIQFNVAPVWEYETGSVQTVTAEKVWKDSDDNEITKTENMPDVEVGLFDALGPAVKATDDTKGTFGYTKDGTRYTVTYEDDSRLKHTYVYDSSGPTLTYTEGENSQVVYGKTNSSDQVVDDKGYVIAWLDGETLHIRIDQQTLNEENDWTYAWELLDPDGDYEVLELSESSRYTTKSTSENLTSYLYWSVIGDNELEEMLANNDEVSGPIILTEAAQEAESTLGDTKDAYGYVIVADENGKVQTKQVEFSQIATMEELTNNEGSDGQGSVWQGTYGVTSQSEIDALGSGALWYMEDSDKEHQDSNGNTIEGFYLYCMLDGRQYYLALNDSGNNLIVTTEKGNASEFFYDLLGEFMVSTVTDGVDNAVRVEIDENGQIYIGEAEWEAALDDVRIYTLSETETGGFAFTATNTLLCEFQLNKVVGEDCTILDGATFSLYKDADCTEQIGFTVTEDENGDTVYTVSDDTEAENYTTTITAGSVTIAGIEGGIYYLKELTAPKNDYVHLNEVITITVKNESGSTNVTVEGAPNHVTAEGDTITVKNDARGNTQVPVEKVWDDADDQDGIRPGSITFHLLADGVEVNSATVTAADGWAYTFTDLPLYKSEDENDQDVKIVYTITEDHIDGYDTTVDGYTVTNSHTPATTEVTVTKVWDDELVPQIRPEEITVQLYADDESYGGAVTLTEAGNWTYTWDDLPVNAAGKEIVYTVEEADVAGYTPTYDITGDAENGYAVKITNTPNPEKLSIQKVVAGESDTTEYEFRITLKSGDTAYSGDIEVTYSDGSTGTLTFKNGTADVTITAGDTITLTLTYGMSWEVVELTEGADSTVIYVGNEIKDTASGTITGDTPVRFVNSYRGYFPIDEEITPDDTDRSTWVKDEAVNEYNAIEIEMSTLLPVITGYDLENGSFTMNFHEVLDHDLVLDEADADFSVYIAGNKIDHKYYTVTISPDDGCSFHVDVDLTELYKDGVISEDDLQGNTEIMIFFFADLEGTGLNGTYKSTVWYEVYDGDEQEYFSNVDVVYVYTYEIDILKYDASTLSGSDYEGSALAGATLGVYYDRACTDPVSRNGEPYTVTSDSDGKAVFYGLANGTYYVKEIAAPAGYVLSTQVLTVLLGEELHNSGNMFESVFANTPETRDISGAKIWEDDNNKADARPESITVNLYQNDKLYESKVVTADDGWTWSWTGLPKYDEKGNVYVYTIDEDTVEYYTATYYSNGNFNITNTFVGEEGVEHPTPAPDKGGDTPKTGDTNNIGLWIALVVAAIAAALVAFRLRRRVR